MITVTDGFRLEYPDVTVGVLAMGNVVNLPENEGLENKKREIEKYLRENYGGLDKAGLRQIDPIRTYNAYYKRWGHTYHVLAQIESVASKGRSIPKIAALVEAMFMAELKNMLLTAGHDIDKLAVPLQVEVARGGEVFNGIRGCEEVVKAGDIMITDQVGVISSILSGPDRRTSIGADTRNVLFTVYAPPGISKEKVLEHLQDIRAYVAIFANNAETLVMKVL